MSLSHSPKVVTDGLVLYLDAANQRSYPKTGSVWSDLVGANDGTLENSPTFSSNNIGGIVFDGTDDLVYISNLNAGMFSAGATIFVFLKLANATPSHPNQTGLWGFGSSIYRSHYPWTNGYAYMDTFRTDRLEGIPLSSSVDRTKPHSLCVTSKNNDRWKMYQNTEVVRDVAAQSSINLPCNYFGRSCVNPSWSDVYVEGTFYTFLMYNRALTADEVRQNYLATRGRYK
jgi:hypothetical protein